MKKTGFGSPLLKELVAKYGANYSKESVENSHFEDLAEFLQKKKEEEIRFSDISFQFK